jgi:broad specificity phosphatase PhoE
MTTKFFFVRHAAHDNVGAYLAGRMEGVRLGPDGLAQARRLGERMRRENFAAIIASPRQRTRETALAISDAAGIGPVKIAGELDEIDFGHWSGRSFDELNSDPAWRAWNDNRGEASTPAGETMAQVQQRVIGFAQRIANASAAGRAGAAKAGAAKADAAKAGASRAVVLVSHADVIKAAVCHFLGMPLANLDRFEISPASVTTLVVGEWGSRLYALNETID